MTASSSPSRASHRPEKPASSVSLTAGPETSNRAVNDESATVATTTKPWAARSRATPSRQIG